MEAKKVIKSRRTYVLVAVALFLTVIMAYLPVTFEYADYYDGTGKRTELEGAEAIAYLKEIRKDITGVVTPEKVRLAVEQYQAVMQEYGVTESYDLPEGVYSNRIVPFSPLLRGVKEAFANRENGMAPSVMEIRAEQVDGYYEACVERLESLMKMEQKDNPDIGERALDMYQDVETPYVYYPGCSSNALEYEGFLAMLLLLIGIIIAAPVFSSDYQTGADDILRCTKHGSFRLGLVKAIAVLGITSFLFIVCMTVYLLISNAYFGWESLQTSMQLEFSVTNLADWDLGDLQLAIVIACMLAFIATICFVLFVSSRCRNVVTTLSIGFVVCLAPMFLSMLLNDSSKVALWMRCILPSNGVCPPDGFLYEAVDYKFLQAGGLIMWVPYAMLIFAGIEALLFAILAVRSYIGHRLK